MNKIHLTSRTEWRDWFSRNHDKERQGIWLVFYRKTTGKTAMEYNDAVEEALCFGLTAS
jgi:uncharacterized protein YdeI (YjbR/CyaY-like superfamily)